MDMLKDLVGKLVCVITLEGRTIVGTLKGQDAAGNVVLSEAHERIFSSDKGMEQDPLGLYLVRGDSVGLLGEVDVEKDSAIEWEAVRAAAPKAIVLRGTV